MTWVATTRIGRAPIAQTEQQTHAHDFKTRFLTPEPKPEIPVAPPVERPRVDPAWSTPMDVIFGEFDESDQGEDAETDVAEALEVEAIADDFAEEELELSPVEAPRTITVAASPATDVSGVDDLELAAAITERLGADIRVANFGDQWMLEERVPRVSRGDLRRMKDYIQEQERPLTDDMLVQDVFGIRPGSADFDLMRFAVNFRLSKEHRDFDFVGTAGQRFWSTSSLPQIGTKRRKPNEIGTDLQIPARGNCRAAGLSIRDIS